MKALVDTSALIPLARVGELDLVKLVFDQVLTTRPVVEELLVEGQPGTAALKDFVDDVRIRDAPPESPNVASLEGISATDASVVLAANQAGSILLANDKALIQVARAHDVDCWWVTTLLLECTQRGHLDAEEAKEVLGGLVDAGMNLHPRILIHVQNKLEDV